MLRPAQHTAAQDIAFQEKNFRTKQHSNHNHGKVTPSYSRDGIALPYIDSASLLGDVERNMAP